jgi:hypothetical protein
MKTTIATAASAIAARARSGVRLLAMPQIACATTATATSFRPWSTPSAKGPVNAVAPSAKAKRMRADGMVKANHAANPAKQTVAAQDAQREADLAGGRTGQELAKRDDVGVAAFVQPFPALDEFRPEIAEMRDRAAERGEAQFEESGENFGHGARGLFRHASQLR